MVDYNLILNVFLGILSYKLLTGCLLFICDKLEEKLEEIELRNAVEFDPEDEE